MKPVLEKYSTDRVLIPMPYRDESLSAEGTKCVCPPCLFSYNPLMPSCASRFFPLLKSQRLKAVYCCVNGMSRNESLFLSRLILLELACVNKSVDHSSLSFFPA